MASGVDQILIRYSEKFKVFGNSNNKNFIHEGVKSRLSSGILCTIQFSSCLLSNHLKFEIYKTIILSVVLYGC
jgi:hypothetical protein